MEITHLGNTSFRLKGKIATLITDPAVAKLPKHVMADIVTGSAGEVEGSPYVINGPGEYEIKGVGVIGRTIEKNTMYRIEIDGLSIVHLGDVNRTLSTEEVDSLDGVDILMIPVSGSATVPVINEIEPSIVIPMRYSRDELAAFLKEIGKEDVVPQPKLIVTRDKLPEQMQVVILE
jgi:L-ascorbate metabolism protein UlaG (beta-lactamase superfamily)